MHKSFKSISVIGIVLFASAFYLNAVSATPAPGSISSSPASGSHLSTEQFNVQIVVNAGGENFTTFGATVTTSNLSIVSLTKGPSIVSCTTEPTKTSLSFFCGVSGSTTSAVVYTLKVKGINNGTARVNISNCSIKHTDGVEVAEICGTNTSANFTITGSRTNNPTSTPELTATPTETPTETPGPSITPTSAMHVITVVDTNGNPVANATVVIDGIEYKADANGRIITDHVITSVSKVKITSNNITIDGKVLSGDVEANASADPAINPDLVTALVAVLIGSTIITVLILTRKRKKSEGTQV